MRIWSCLVQQRPEFQHVPGWPGFNQLMSKNDPQPTIIDPLPIVNAAAQTLWTVTLKCQAITKLTHGRYSNITLDEALKSKAKIMQWTKTDECKNLVIIHAGRIPHTDDFLHSDRAVRGILWAKRHLGRK